MYVDLYLFWLLKTTRKIPMYVFLGNNTSRVSILIAPTKGLDCMRDFPALFYFTLPPGLSACACSAPPTAHKRSFNINTCAKISRRAWRPLLAARSVRDDGPSRRARLTQSIKCAPLSRRAPRAGRLPMQYQFLGCSSIVFLGSNVYRIIVRQRSGSGDSCRSVTNC